MRRRASVLTKRSLAVAAALLILALLNVQAHRKVSLADLTDVQTQDLLKLPSGPVVTRALSLGFSAFLSDLYLLKTQIFLFDHQTDPDAREKLFGLFDLVTTLDPSYADAYILAHYTLSGLYDNLGVAQANELSRRAMAYLRDDCRFYRNIGINFYMYSAEPQRAAPYLLAAKDFNTPDRCPTSMVWMADEANIKSGADPCVRQGIICGQYEEGMRQRQDRTYLKLLNQRCQGLHTLCELNHAIAQYRRTLGGRCPGDIRDLMAGLKVAGNPPKEPFGGYYFIDADCEAQSSTGLRPTRNNQKKQGGE